VLITAHQAFLTHEALSEITRVTLDSISRFRDGLEPVAERVVK
jgi:lactate dehydrogenase-like 2-hydroxyacid dehydrogenase